MDGKRTVQDWLNTAVSGIRFKPDREAVEQELREHLEDKVEDLERFYHLSREEAEKMALGQMGDAAEIGREMAKIHKPWWGIVWTVTRVLLPVVIVAAFFSWFGTGDNIPSWEYWDWDGLPGTPHSDMVDRNDKNDNKTYLPNGGVKQLMAKECDESVWVNGQRISVRYAAIWREGEEEVLYLALKLETPLFWERGILYQEWMNAVDSEGNRWNGADENRGMLANGYGPFHSWDEFILEGVDPEAEWVRLDYGPAGDIFSLTVELEREGVE